MTSSSNRHGKAKTYEPWTTTQEIVLCKAWCEALENYNAGDMRTTFWSVVFANFQKEMEEIIQGYDTVVVKWKIRFVLKLLRLVAFTIVSNGWTRTEALRETLEEEAKAEKKRAKAKKEWEEFVKQEQAHDELFRLEFGVKSDSEYESD
nr:hypothetical protein [Tanacetum cinerariifolium]